MFKKFGLLQSLIKPAANKTTFSILEYEHPYKDLVQNGNITRFRSEIEKLQESDKIAFAGKIVMDCEDLEALGMQLRATESNKYGKFFTYLVNAYAIRCNFERLAGGDPSRKNQTPQAYQIVTDEEFNPDLFNQYQSLTNVLIAQKRREIVYQLAKDTPEQPSAERQVFQRLKFIQDVDFNTALNSAFMVKRLTNQELLGNSPQAFFLNPELRTKNRNFDSELIASNIELIAFYVSGKEEEIGKKLANSSQANGIGVILTDLESATEVDSNQTFSKISNAFKLERKNKVSSNPHGHFASTAAPPAGSVPENAFASP